MMSNQAVRQQIENASPDYQRVINNIKDGTPEVMFSKEASNEITRTKVKKYAEKYGFDYTGIDGNIDAFYTFVDDAIIISSNNPGVLRAVDLYTWVNGTKNKEFEKHMMAVARQDDHKDIFVMQGSRVKNKDVGIKRYPRICLLYTSPSPRD